MKDLIEFMLPEAWREKGHPAIQHPELSEERSGVITVDLHDLRITY